MFLKSLKFCHQYKVCWTNFLCFSFICKAEGWRKQNKTGLEIRAMFVHHCWCMIRVELCHKNNRIMELKISRKWRLWVNSQKNISFAAIHGPKKRKKFRRKCLGQRSRSDRMWRAAFCRRKIVISCDNWQNSNISETYSLFFAKLKISGLE